MKYFASLLLCWFLTSGTIPKNVESNVLISQKIEVNVSECSADLAAIYKYSEVEMVNYQFQLDLKNKLFRVISPNHIKEFTLELVDDSLIILNDYEGNRYPATWIKIGENRILKLKEDKQKCYSFLIYFSST